MRARYFILSVAVMLGLTSCRTSQVESMDAVFCTSEAGEFPATQWQAGDRISLFNGNTGNKVYEYSGDSSGTSGSEFHLVSGKDGEFSVPGNYAVFPWAESNMASHSGTLYIDLPATQTPSLRPAMAAYSSDSALNFRQLCGTLAIMLSGSGELKSVVLTGNGGEKLAGRAVVEFSTDGTPSVRLSSSGTSASLTLELNPILSLGSTAAELRFSLPQTSFSGGVTLSLIGADGSSTELKIPEEVRVERGRKTVLNVPEVAFSNPAGVVPGEPLPAWQEGWLDIHSINGGRGESFFYIFPDGTTMLVDAAGTSDFEIVGESGSGIYSRPSQQYSSGEVIVRYLQHYMPAISNGRIDYFMLSHYHGDHMGSFSNAHAKYGWKAVDKNGSPVSKVDVATGGFLLNGLPQVGFSFPIDKLIDRGEWDNPASNVWLSGQTRRQNYLNFIDWSRRTNGTERETLAVGHTDQIIMKHAPGQYPGFKVRGIAAGGNIWTGSGTSVNTTYVPSAAEFLANAEAWDVNENIFSCVFTLSYGKFDMFSGGDIQYNDRGKFSWKDIELPISKVVSKVEVMKACHHSTSNTNSTALLNALKPDCYVIGVWTKNQPNPSTLKRVYSANKDVKIFATNLSGHIISLLSEAGIDSGTFLARGGHVVIRVAPGGEEYYVLVLDDGDFEYRVTEVFGPFVCS